MTALILLLQRWLTVLSLQAQPCRFMQILGTMCQCSCKSVLRHCVLVRDGVGSIILINCLSSLAAVAHPKVWHLDAELGKAASLLEIISWLGASNNNGRFEVPVYSPLVGLDIVLRPILLRCIPSCNHFRKAVDVVYAVEL